MIRTGVFVADSVSEGHPDKLADRIADAILDEFLALDPNAQVLCEAVVTNQFIMIIGEFTARGDTFDVVQDQMDPLVRRLLRNTGYRHSKIGMIQPFATWNCGSGALRPILHYTATDVPASPPKSKGSSLVMRAMRLPN